MPISPKLDAVVMEAIAPTIMYTVVDLIAAGFPFGFCDMAPVVVCTRGMCAF